MPRHLISIAALIILSACTPTPNTEEQKKAPTKLLALHGLTTTAYTIDSRTHLLICANHACRDNQTKQVICQDVTAGLTLHDHTALTITTPRATWCESLQTLIADGPLTGSHPYGVLCAKAGARLRLSTHRLDLCGPVAHTITYGHNTRHATAA